uniref:Uncharacterized protein n=1 Tax=Meloidogyne enterolobii TaxID=390850 RepID=A0A6V7XH40_MELEN|nr:unnamed protein product [Meloidogyne enterolobii]
MTMSILKTVASYSTIKDTVNIEYECHSRLGSYVLQVSRSDFPGLATSNNSIVENGGYHLTHHKPRFSDRNFDYDSLVDAETENADRLEEENSPLLQQSSENENGADNDNEVETTEENGINIVKNTFVGGPSTRRKKDLYVGPEDKAKGKQVENTKVKKDSVHGNTRRK